MFDESLLACKVQSQFQMLTNLLILVNCLPPQCPQNFVTLNNFIMSKTAPKILIKWWFESLQLVQLQIQQNSSN
uniref:Ovule protein n=1 Tax=Schistosoma mansoni TaxID=6183 RepID=A0A5K4F8Y0_SCHMA